MRRVGEGVKCAQGEEGVKRVEGGGGSEACSGGGGRVKRAHTKLKCA